MTGKRSFLFLQGPQSRFFKRLGLAVADHGHQVTRINFCGGDVIHWPAPFTMSYRGSMVKWPTWVDNLYRQKNITDLLLFGDRRPLHSEALLLARQRGIRVHVFEEGYLRPAHITLEQDGVNGCSCLPSNPDEIRSQAYNLEMPPKTQPLPNPLKKRVMDAVRHHVGNTLLMPLFPFYRTHRPYTIAWELQGWIPRYLGRKKRLQEARQKQNRIMDQQYRFFLFPLQLDSDFQIRLYSDFTSLTETITHVLYSFARHAPKDCFLVVKNHPLDNGLINYQEFTTNYAKALGVEHRVIFLDGGDGGLLMKKARGMVLVNSTMGLEGLTLGSPVFCLGRAIYALPGLAVTEKEQRLDNFWKQPKGCDPQLLSDFQKIILHQALVYGNFYTDQGIAAAVKGSLQRIGVS